MIATEAPPTSPRITRIEVEPLNYLNERHSIGSWLLTTDHKRIGLLYLFSIIIFFAIAAVAAALMRLELITPQGDLVTACEEAGEARRPRPRVIPRALDADG